MTEMMLYLLRKCIKTKFLSVIAFLTGICIYLARRESHDEVNDFNHPIIIWWTPFLYEDKQVICQNLFKCVVTKNRKFQHSAAAFLFYGSNFDKYDLPLPKNLTPWAIFHEESPKNLALFLHRESQEIFNITSTFSRNSDLPLTLQYLEDINSITDVSYYRSLSEKNLLLNDISPILYIQSDCDTPIERDFFVSELMKYVKVDSYGKCLNNKELPKELTFEQTLENLYEPTFMKFVSRYKFVVAIENAVCDDYITEKLWRPLMVGSIPIYLGSPTVSDWLPHNRSAILVKDYESIVDLANFITTLNTNDTMYEEYMAHKMSKKISNHRLKYAFQKGKFGIEHNEDFTVHAFECFVCKSVYENWKKRPSSIVYNCDKPKAGDPRRDNWWISHWRNGKCEAKTLQYFVQNLKTFNYTKDMFENKSKEFLDSNEC
ncbi:hypothetical protein FQR65_LT04403 [Abscondita terminalis]|nr:hypothetical protein FQR65_LT04403 [Abscondita terminalis]